MNDKIKISWNDVNSADVDQKLKQQDAVSRATQHYQQNVGPSGPAIAANSGSSIWYSSLATAVMLGMIGGLCAWIGGELVFLLIPNYLEELQTVGIRESAIIASANSGDLSESEAMRRIEEVYDEYNSNPYVKLIRDKSLSEDTKKQLVKDQIEKDKMRGYIQQMIWFSTLGIPIALCLAITEGVAGRNWRACIINGSVGIALGLVGGMVVGLFINQLYVLLAGGLEDRNLARQVFARAIGWAILGLFLAIAPGIVLRNVKRLCIGLAGGFLGGLLGGLMFDPLSFVGGSDVLSRFIAIVAIGVIAGLGTGLIENAAKTGWMKVVAGLIAGKQFILYKNPTLVGSSPQCDIYLFKDLQIAPQHAAIRNVPGGYEIQDLNTQGGTLVNGAPISRTRLKNNDQIQIGETVFTFQEKTKPN